MSSIRSFRQFSCLIRLRMIAALSLAGAGQHAIAADIHVPADQPTIQQAIDAAADGDRVLVAPGRYREAIDFKGKNILVVATHGARQTMIDGTGQFHVVTFKSGETEAASIQRFNIALGRATGLGNDDAGGGIFVAGDAKPDISRNWIESDTGCRGGGIAVVDSAAPHIHDNEIDYNYGGCSGGDGGAGLWIASRGRVVVEHNQIASNSGVYGGGIGVVDDESGKSDALIARNTIIDNQATYGGGIYLHADHVRVADDLIAFNRSSGGAGMYITAEGHQHPLVVNNTLAGDKLANGQFYGPEIIADGEGGLIDIVNNIIYNVDGLDGVACNYGLGPTATLHDNLIHTPGGATQTLCDVKGVLLTDDPQFVGSGLGKSPHPFWLRPTSPAIDVGDDAETMGNRLDLTGVRRIQGAAVDLGAIEFRQD